MSAAAARMLEAAAWMRNEPAPLYGVLSAWITRVAEDARMRRILSGGTA